MLSDNDDNASYAVEALARYAKFINEHHHPRHSHELTTQPYYVLVSIPTSFWLKHVVSSSAFRHASSCCVS